MTTTTAGKFFVCSLALMIAGALASPRAALATSVSEATPEEAAELGLNDENRHQLRELLDNGDPNLVSSEVKGASLITNTSALNRAPAVDGPPVYESNQAYYDDNAGSPQDSQAPDQPVIESPEAVGTAQLPQD
jgi:hypothetical protein